MGLLESLGICRSAESSASGMGFSNLSHCSPMLSAHVLCQFHRLQKVLNAVNEISCSEFLESPCLHRNGHQALLEAWTSSAKADLVFSSWILV